MKTVSDPWSNRERRTALLVIGGLIVIVALLLAFTDLADASTCMPIRDVPARVTNVARYPGRVPRYQVALRAQGGYVAAFNTFRRYRVGQAVIVSGCADGRNEIFDLRVK